MRPAFVSDLSARSERAVAASIASTALRVERAISVARVPFFGAVVVRYLLLGHFTAPAVLLTVLPLALGIAFSLHVLVFVRQPPTGEARYVVSTTIDATACFAALLPNILWPGPDYSGILFMPDTAGILVATLGSGFRLSPRAALVGSGANLAGLLVLIVLDRVHHGARFEVSVTPATIFTIFVLASGALAWILAVTTRRLVRRGALAATRADRAEQGLGSLLADSHDLRSLLASAMVNADLLSADLERPDEVDDTDRPGDLSRHLVDDLRRIGDILVDVRSRALGDLTALGVRTSVDLASPVRRVVEQLRRRYPTVDLRVGDGDGDVCVLVAGGEPTLSRILLNLVQNACEGDGTTQGTHVTVRSEVDPGASFVRIHVEDDGPGLSARVLGGSRVLASTKPDHLGVGIAVARGLAEASGGHLGLANRQGSGARATVVLPVAGEPAR